ncbi:MAG TPA: ComEA family DNA-binding protein [Nitrosomonas sp.]|nr:ComEA family DNA-binding protein [Nitrosomonas sp.]
MKKILLMMSLSILLVSTSFAAVNINTASQAELESLHGIGAAKAKAIIEYREKNGSFTSIDDLKKVNGIGSATIEQLRDLVAVEADGAVTPAK